MGMSIDKSIENIVLLKKLEDSLGNISGNTNSAVSQSLGCAIDTMRKYQMFQADYEQRLKADMVAMLEEIDLQFDEICFYKNRGEWKTVPEIKAEYKAVIREKINALKGESEAEE